MAKPLFLPRAVAEEAGYSTPPPAKTPSRRAEMRLIPSAGRKVGLPVGGWIDDLAALEKAIFLCFSCVHRFDHERAHYHKDTRLDYVRADCDGCRRLSSKAQIYIHESALTEPGGQQWSGLIWTPA